MRESVPRFMLVLTGIVAIVALCLGIRDYFEQRNETNHPSATPAVVGSEATIKQKITTSAKTSKQRVSATEASAPASPGIATDSPEKPLIAQDPGKSEARAIVVTDGLNSEKDQAAHRELEAVMEVGNRAVHERTTIPHPALASCLPLPNGTEFGDVDAPYYGNWSGEYCGR